MKIIELPCNIGETVYRLNSEHTAYDKLKVTGFLIKSDRILVEMGHSVFENAKSERLCYTVAEAERKIRY